MQAVPSRTGPVALVGSGEYLDHMADVDGLLLAQVGGASARVVVLPTAAGLEDPSSPRRWAEKGTRHFRGLGAQTDAANILVREDAFDSRWLSLLEHADLIYFSGGNPRHVIETMQGSPAWEIILLRHAAGAALAGCSAGAMAFGHVTLQPRRLWSTSSDEPATWFPALDLVPGVVVLPHFDRWTPRMGEAVLKRLAASLPTGVSLIGIDEDTALVRLDGATLTVWQVMGRRSVSVIDPEAGLLQHAAGSTIVLDRPVPTVSK